MERKRKIGFVVCLLALILACAGCQTMDKLSLLSRSRGLPQQWEAEAESGRE